MFREKYRRMSDQVHPNGELLDLVLKSAGGGRRKRFGFSKPAMAVLAVCICAFLAAPVLASTVEPVYRLMYRVSPGVAQFFIPVQKSHEDNGIKMEVTSAYIHDNVAEIYITMQDLTGDRVDGSIDLYDSYSINRPFDSAASCRRVGYDERTKTATFLITIEEWGNQKIVGHKITFSVKEFLSRKTVYEDIPIPIDLASAGVVQTVQKVNASGGGGADIQKYLNRDTVTALVPTEARSEFPVKGIELTAIGYIDDMLHIQTAVRDRLNNDNHGFFYLKKDGAEPINGNYNFYFANQSEQPGRIDYCEYVFNIPREEIESYALYGYFVTAGMRTEGNWKVTFSLE